MNVKSMQQKITYPVMSVFFTLLVLFSVVGCGGGDGTTAATSGETITGAVIDGYVNGATVTVYSDLALTTQIGSGTTNAGGQFSIELTVARVPDPVYIRSVGGIDIDTGLPAPTMMFVVDGGAIAELNVTPMTNAVYERVASGQSLPDAQLGLLSDLGLASSTELYGNPVVSGSLQAAMFRALTSGTMGATLAAGDYQLFVITAGKDQIVGGAGEVTGISSISALVDPANGLFIGPIPFTVAANGDISGTYLFTPAGSGTPITAYVTGKVQGSAIVFNVIDQDPASGPPTGITRVVGTIGLNGSVSGSFTDMQTGAGGPNLTQGVFVGSFIPATGANAAGMATFASNYYSPGGPSATDPGGTGRMNVVARDVFVPAGMVPGILWGRTTMTAFDTATGAVTMSDLWVRQDAGSTAQNSPTHTVFTAGEYIRVGTTPTNLIVLEYDLGTAKMYLVTAAGIRRGIYMAVSTAAGANQYKLDSVGESYMTKTSGIVPGLNVGTTYDVTLAWVNVDMLEQSRAAALFGMPIPVQPVMIPPTFDPARGYYDVGPELVVVMGSVMAMKKDADNNFADNADYIRAAEFFESGAMMGEMTHGGTVTPPGAAGAVQKSDFPSTFVGFYHPDGTASPSFSGSLNFLARTIYASDPGTFGAAVISGSLDITAAPTTTGAGAATLTVTAPDGTANNATMTIEPIGMKYGMYHIHGQATGAGAPYIDLYWPIGGKKAAYVLSEPNGSSVLTVMEVGEAYITQ